jgi:hypothetical protein
VGWGAFAGYKSLAGVYTARTDLGVDHAIAGIVHGISAAISTAVVSIAGKPVVVVMMTEAAKSMATEVVPTAVKATAATEVAATKATGGRRSGDSCGRSESDNYENKFTKHFDLHLCGALHRFNGAKI